MNKTRNKIIGAIYTVVTALLLLIGNSCVVLIDKSISGNGIVETQRCPRRDFDAVSVDGDWTVDIRYSETFSVTVDADKNLSPYLDIYVSDNILHIVRFVRVVGYYFVEYVVCTVDGVVAGYGRHRLHVILWNIRY